MRSEWNFDDTIRGTVKGVPIALDLAEIEEDEEEEAWDLEDKDKDQQEDDEEAEWLDGTTRVRSGPSTMNVGITSFSVGLGQYADVQASEVSLPTLGHSPLPTPSLGSPPLTPRAEAPDLHSSTGSSSSTSGKSTWKERNSSRGTILKGGDVGDG